jgi:hypothetical protein
MKGFFLKKIIDRKYGMARVVWCPGVVKTSYGVGLLKYISLGWDRFVSLFALRWGTAPMFCLRRIIVLEMEVLDSLILSYSKLLLMGMLLCSIMWTWLMVLCCGSLFSIVGPFL